MSFKFNYVVAVLIRLHDGHNNAVNRRNKSFSVAANSSPLNSGETVVGTSLLKVQISPNAGTFCRCK
jgi:hypothetical protein